MRPVSSHQREVRQKRLAGVPPQGEARGSFCHFAPRSPHRSWHFQRGIFNRARSRVDQTDLQRRFFLPRWLWTGPSGGREGGNLATFSFVRTRFPAYPRTGANLLSMRGQELAPALCTKYLRGRTRKPYGYYATMREPYGYYATTPCCC